MQKKHLSPRKAQSSVKSIPSTQILDSMRVPSRGSLYAIGPFPKRVNFASQQMRALNLIWALSEQGLLPQGSRIAVVGAGIAGLMAAGALKRRGHDVTVLEKTNKLMPLQRYTTSRYVHPTINYWPQIELTPALDFPFMYWAADICANVVSTIEAQWNEEFRKLVKFDCNVVNIKNKNDKFYLSIKDGRIEYPFDVVVLAVGFGLEASIEGSVAPSYWDDCDLRKCQIDNENIILVSGVGDGGLLEVLRLAYDNFGEGQLTTRIARWVNRTALRDYLERAENEAQAMLADAKAALDFLFERYLTSSVDSDLEAFLKSVLPTSHCVTLLSRCQSAFSPTSAPIHRFMLAQAIQRGRVRVEVGELAILDSKPFLKCAECDDKPLAGDKFVVRHGPVGVLRNLLKKEELDRLASQQEVLSEYHYKPFWPSGFFEPRSKQDARTKYISLQKRLDVAKAALHKEFPGVILFGITKYKSELIYEMRIVKNESNVNKSREDEMPSRIFGRKLIVKRSDPYALFGSHSGTASISKDPKNMRFRLLQPGDRVKLSRANGLEGVIGCFISIDGDDHALTAGHIVGNKVGAEIVASGHGAEHWVPIGRISEKLIDNRKDLALIRLNKDIGFDVDSQLVQMSTLHHVGDAVACLRSEKAPTTGVISCVDALVHFQTTLGEISIEDLLVVTNSEKGFGGKGYSGALVRQNDLAVGVVIGGNDSETLVSPIARLVATSGGKLASANHHGRKVVQERIPIVGNNELSSEGTDTGALSVSDEIIDGGVRIDSDHWANPVLVQLTTSPSVATRSTSTNPSGIPEISLINESSFGMEDVRKLVALKILEQLETGAFIQRIDTRSIDIMQNMLSHPILDKCIQVNVANMARDILNALVGSDIQAEHALFPWLDSLRAQFRLPSPALETTFISSGIVLSETEVIDGFSRMCVRAAEWNPNYIVALKGGGEIAANLIHQTGPSRAGMLVGDARLARLGFSNRRKRMGSRVLLVDDISRTGATLARGYQACHQLFPDSAVRGMALVGSVESDNKLGDTAFFPNVSMYRSVRVPWDTTGRYKKTRDYHVLGSGRQQPLKIEASLLERTIHRLRSRL